MTVWDKPGKYIYIIPEKYTKLTLPPQNYIRSYRNNIFLIIWNKPDDYDFTLTWTNNYPIKINLPGYKYKALNRNLPNDEKEYEKSFLNDHFTFKEQLDYFEVDFNR